MNIKFISHSRPVGVRASSLPTWTLYRIVPGGVVWLRLANGSVALSSAVFCENDKSLVEEIVGKLEIS